MNFLQKRYACIVHFDTTHFSGSISPVTSVQVLLLIYAELAEIVHLGFAGKQKGAFLSVFDGAGIARAARIARPGDTGGVDP